jgi:tRNA U34 5-methylaminomethyl-2-thiouridine-forming methyltransferase MnmC
MEDLEIIVTADGSHTLRNRKLDETYHSIHGAIQESRHVFIRNGLQFYHETRQSKEMSILEIGFGTGLNALLTQQYAEEHDLNVHYTTLEPFPLEREVWSVLNYGQGDRKNFENLHMAPWRVEYTLST